MITEGSNVQGAAMSGPHSVNGTYDQVVFTARAVEHIYATAAKNANIERRRNMQRNHALNHGRNNSMTAKETAEAVTVADEVEVEMEEQQQPLFVALMYHNVHDACMKDRKMTSGLNAPFETVNLYSTTKLDTWKVMGAMVTELDYGMGNLTDALEGRRGVPGCDCRRDVVKRHGCTLWWPCNVLWRITMARLPFKRLLRHRLSDVFQLEC